MTSSSLFLRLSEADLTLVNRYHGTLAASAESLAHDFYAYLLAHPGTAAVFRDFSPEQMKHLLATQTEHVRLLLHSSMDRGWQKRMREISARHQALGIAPALVAGAYILYWNHWQARLREMVPEQERDALLDALFRLIVGNLMAQQDGYHEAARATDAERMTIFRVLLDVLAEPAVDDPQTRPLLHRICEGLVRTSKSIRLACYALADEGADALVPEFSVGISTAGLRIPRHAENICWTVLREGTPVIQVVDDPAAPSWLHLFRGKIAELVLFPFGDAGLRGVGMVGVNEAGYFRRVGLAYFAAFANLGDLTLGLRTAALRDPLTALPNRALFLDRLEHARSHARRRERLLGVALLDLDGFKQINDRYGHGAGDKVLQQLAGQMQAALRPMDTLARLGGDEFAILFVDIERMHDMEALCERILEALRAPVDIGDGQMASVSGSLGVTLFPLDDADAETLMCHADLSLYAAKSAGRDQYCLHSPDLDEVMHQDFLMREMVAQALQENHLVLHYQPIAMIGGGVIGVEALLRLAHPSRGLLTPSAFATALDHRRLARPIGCFVLEAAATQGEAWQGKGMTSAGGHPLRISINISAHHLLDPLFLDDLRETLSRHPGLAPEMLEIEITESAPLHDLVGAQEVLRACNALGVRIALDDFGTGAASLTYLQKLPAHTLKIDQGFVRDMVNDPKDFAIVSGVVHVANLLGLEVIAEGAETLEHMALLQQMRCRYVQGYAIAKPMPAQDIPAWLAQYRPIPEKTISFQLHHTPVVMAAHEQRVGQFLAALRGQASFPEHVLEETAENQCHLGLWLRGEGYLMYGNDPRYSTLDARHQRLHHLAREAKALLDAGEVESAWRLGDQLATENTVLMDNMRELAEEPGLLKSSHS